MRTIFSSESVTEGHPDKVCDQVADAVLDACLAREPYARVACEVVATADYMLIMGELSASEMPSVEEIARGVIKDIGYTRPGEGFDAETCRIDNRLHRQSPDIAMGVEAAFECRKSGSEDEWEAVGAGDQGMVFGYATNETESFLPLPAYLSHRLTRQLAKVRKEEKNSFLRPDGKALVAVEYENAAPLRAATVVLSTQHAESVSQEELHGFILEKVIAPVVPKELLQGTRFLINPTGRFVVGGPAGDSGLTGRKIIVDTYGGGARHGGGSFSGKDPTKVDRSAAYMARFAAKNLVAAGVADRCELEIGYAIGCARPVSVLCETFGTAHISEERIQSIVEKVFDFRPAAIMETLDLRRPIYRATAAYGHFGRTDVLFPWEEITRAEDIRRLM